MPGKCYIQTQWYIFIFRVWALNLVSSNSYNGIVRVNWNTAPVTRVTFPHHLLMKEMMTQVNSTPAFAPPMNTLTRTTVRVLEHSFPASVVFSTYIQLGSPWGININTPQSIAVQDIPMSNRGMFPPLILGERLPA